MSSNNNGPAPSCPAVTAGRRVLRLEAGPVPERLVVAVASLALSAAVAEDGPVLIASEDAHWVGAPTRDIMMSLIVRLEAHDVRALFTRRALTSAEHVPDGIGMPDTGPLADDAAQEPLDRLHPGLPEEAGRLSWPNRPEIRWP